MMKLSPEPTKDTFLLEEKDIIVYDKNRYVLMETFGRKCKLQNEKKIIFVEKSELTLDDRCGIIPKSVNVTSDNIKDLIDRYLFENGPYLVP